MRLRARAWRVWRAARLHVAVGVGAAVTALCALGPAASPFPPTRAAEPKPRFAHTFDVTQFQRGNLHAHSSASDGDARPSAVIEWYKEHGYQFVAVTDHNVLTDPSLYASLQDERFTVLSGEEVSMWVAGKQVHVNALCTSSEIAGGDFGNATDALTAAVSRVVEQRGVAIVNHPNFDWALAPRDVLAVAGPARLLEIASGHPYVHSDGDAAHPSHEAVWDDALGAGRDVMGVAVDDVHHIRASADPPAFPGLAWVEVFADTVDPGVLCVALSRGDLYSSTGPKLRRIRVSENEYAVDFDDEADSVTFIGRGGRLLTVRTKVRGPVTYRARGDEGYVRVRIVSARGKVWTPAVRVMLE